MSKKTNSEGFRKLLCPVCGRKRLFDVKGLPDGDYEIKDKCPDCGLVLLKPEYIKNELMKPGR